MPKRKISNKVLDLRKYQTNPSGQKVHDIVKFKFSGTQPKLEKIIAEVILSLGGHVR